jgi:CRP/FNR family transcriptional activator FtrB
MGSDSVFMAAVVVELARAYRTAVKDLKNQKLRAGAERLANWVIRRDAEQGGRGSVTLDIEKRTLASRLGMTPENLSRAFATLQAHGVKVSGARIAITRPADLARFAAPNPLIDEPEPLRPS